jgi:hypothetical protein
VMSDLFLSWMAAVLCLIAAIERPDRLKFWLWCCYGCVAVGIITALTGGTL